MKHRLMSPLDVARAHSRTITAIGPMALPPGPVLQKRFHQYAIEGFGRRMTTVPSRRSMRWARPALTPVAPLLTYPAAQRDDIDEVLTQFTRDTAQYLEGTAIGTAGQYLLLSLNHGWGDGHLTLRMNQVMTAPGVYASSGKERRAPLLTACTRFFGAHPATAWEVVRHLRSSAPVESADVAVGERLPWTPSPRQVSASTALTVVDDIRRWRKATGTPASVSAVFFAAMIRELHRQEVPVSNRVLTMFDCRRYLHDVSDVIEVGSNFVAGVELVVDGVPAPQDLNRAIRHTADNGRPLLSLTLSAIKSAMTTSPFGGGVPADATSAEAAPTARITFSDVGSIPFPESTWTAGVPERFFNCLSEPAEPEGLVVNLFQTGGAVHISISFHDNVFDTDRLKAAVSAVVAHPLPRLVAEVPE